MWNNLFCGKACQERKQRRHEEAMARIEMEGRRYDVYSDIANQPATGSNKALVIIPIVILAFGAITAFVLIRKKKK